MNSQESPKPSFATLSANAHAEVDRLKIYGPSRFDVLPEIDRSMRRDKEMKRLIREEVTFQKGMERVLSEAVQNNSTNTPSTPEEHI